MEKRTLMKAVVVLVAVSASVALALPPMGPPMATLKQGQFSAGLQYGYSDMDLEGDGKATNWIDGIGESAKGTLNLKNLKSSWFFGNLGYGVRDNWEAFVRLGIADAEDEIRMDAIELRGLDFSGGYGFAWGFGTKATFLRQGALTWGGLFQMTWANPDDDKFSYTESVLVGETEVPVPLSGDIELDWWEIQIAVGPTWQRDGFCIYGGPFLHLVNGDLDAKASGSFLAGDDTYTASEMITCDLEEDSVFGGYVGAQFDMSRWLKNAFWSAELQFTGDAWAFGMGLFWRLP